MDAAYGFLMVAVLGFAIATEGPAVIMGDRPFNIPAWVSPMAMTGAGVLLFWAALDQYNSRRRPLSDWPIIGWHVFSDIVLTPARLTFGVWNHLSAIVHLNREEKNEALRILRHVYNERKCSIGSLGAQFSNISRLRRLLVTLQLLGWIELQRSGGDRFYVIPSNELEEVTAINKEN